MAAFYDMPPPFMHVRNRRDAPCWHEALPLVVSRAFALGHDRRVCAILQRVAKEEADESASPAAVRWDWPLLEQMKRVLTARMVPGGGRS